MNHNKHPDDGTLQAYADRELAPLGALRCTVHMGRCAACRRRLRDLRAEGEQVAALLRLTLRMPQQRRTPAYFRSKVPYAAAVVLALGLTVAIHGQPSTHAHIAGGTRVQDVCCFNLDGGTRGDDGLLTVSRPGEVVDCVVLYEDRRGTRTFSPLDPLRFISRPEGCDLGTIAAASGHRGS
jgi:hypothetical protein